MQTNSQFSNIHFKNLAVIVAGVLFTLLYWRRMLLGPLVPIDGNLLRYSYPQWMVGKRLLSSLHLLWDPYRNMGQPFLAYPANQALYPIRLLSLAMNFVDYHRIYILIHLGVAFTGAYLLARDFTSSEISGIFAGLLMAFNGFICSKTTLPEYLATSAWLPFAAWFLFRRNVLGLGLALTLQWFAGFPPLFLVGLLFLVFFAVGSDEARSETICLIKGMAIMLGLASLQLVPFLEMFHESSRPLLLNSAAAIDFSLHPIEVARFLFLPSILLKKSIAGGGADPAVSSFFLGPVVLLFASYAAIRGGRRERLLGIAGVVGFVMSLGIFNGFYLRLPFLRIFRFPPHWLLLSLLAMVCLGAKGFLDICKGPVRIIAFIVVAADLYIYAVPSRQVYGDTGFVTQIQRRASGLEVIPPGSRIFHRDLINRNLHKWKLQSVDDWLVMKGFLAPSMGVIYGIKEAESYTVLQNRRTAAFLVRLNDAPNDSALFDIAGISKIISLTRETDVQKMPGWNGVGATDNRNYRAHVFSESGKSVNILTDNPGQLSVAAEGPGRLVFSEAYFPGWKIIVDGQKKPVALFENLFPAVDLAEGSHRVEFNYRPASFVIGLFISLATALFLFLRKKLTQ